MGDFYEALLRRRRARSAPARHHAHVARRFGRHAGEDGRRAGRVGRAVSGASGQTRRECGDLRAGRRPGHQQGAGRAQGRARRHARHADRHRRCCTTKPTRPCWRWLHRVSVADRSAWRGWCSSSGDLRVRCSHRLQLRVGAGADRTVGDAGGRRLDGCARAAVALPRLTVRARPDWHFDAERGAATLREQLLQVATLDALRRRRRARRSSRRAGALLDYARATQRRRLPHVATLRRETRPTTSCSIRSPGATSRSRRRCAARTGRRCSACSITARHRWAAGGCATGYTTLVATQPKPVARHARDCRRSSRLTAP